MKLREAEIENVQEKETRKSKSGKNAEKMVDRLLTIRRKKFTAVDLWNIQKMFMRRQRSPIF